MHSKILVLIVAATACSFASAQWIHDVSAHPVAPVPSVGTGGAQNGCSNPDNKTTITMTCADNVKINNVHAWFLLNHPYAQDLRITISHGGTTVTLFNQYPGTAGKAFNGFYNFDDDAAAGIGSAIIMGQPYLHFGTYLPQTPLSAFDGISGAGQWVFEICDLGQFDSGTLSDCGVGFESGSFYGQIFQVIEPIPDGGAGGCVSPVTHVVNVPASTGPVCRLQVGYEVNHHPRAADVSITLSHGPVSVTLCTASAQVTNPQLSGQYLFEDDAPTTWAQGMTLNTPWLPNGSYRPQSPLSAFDGVESSGLWFLTICDASGNGLVGSLSGFYFGLDVSGYRCDITQPSGSSSIILKNSGGVPGDLYVNAFTFVPGSFPYGWLNGLDISMVELVNQLNSGAPFIGTLDPNGAATLTIPGPIPHLTFQYVTFEVANGIPVASVPARSFTTAP